jgi:hypothetical protein
MADFEMEPLIPGTPLEVCLPFAQKLTFSKGFDDFANHEHETEAVWSMNIALRNFDMLGDYDVKAGLAFIIPEDTTPDENDNVTIHRMDLDLGFNGSLLGARTLKIGKVLGGMTIRAVCLAFEDSLIKYRTTLDKAIIPVFDKVDDEDRVYVPVYARVKMDRAA